MSSDAVKQQLIGRMQELAQILSNSIDNHGGLILRDDMMEFLSSTYRRVEAALKGASAQERNGRLGGGMARIQQLLRSVKTLSVFASANSKELRHFSLYPFHAFIEAEVNSASAAATAAAAMGTAAGAVAQRRKMVQVNTLRHVQLDMCPPSTVKHLYEQRGTLESLTIMNSGITELIPVLSPVRSSVLRKLSPLIYPDALYSLPQTMVWTQLQVLKLSNCGIAKIDASLHFFPHIHTLDLSHNSIVHVVHLQDCVALRVLNLSFNRIRVLSNLERVLGSITQLDVSYNEIQSLDGVDKIYSLEQLIVQRNFVDDFAEIAHLCRLPCLENVDIAGNPLADLDGCRLYIFREFIKDGSALSKGRSFPAICGKHMTKREKQVLRRIMFRNTGAAAEVDFSHAGDRYQRTSLMTIRPDDVTASVAACGGSLDGDESDEDDDDTEGDFFAQATYSSDSDIITGLDPLPDHAGFTSSRLTGASGAASGRSSRRSKSRTASTASAGGAASVAARLSFTRSTGRASAAGRSNSSSWRAAESRVQRDADASPYVPRKLRSELTRSASVRTKRPAVITARRPPDASDAVADASATDATIDCSAAFPSLADVEEQLRMQREQHRTKYMSMMSNERLRSLTCGDSVSNKNGFVPPAARQTEKQDDAAASTTATAAVAIAAEVDDGNDTSSSASEKSDAASDAIDAAAFATPPKETHEKSRTLGCTPPLLVMEDEGAAEARQLSAASSGSSPLSPVESSTMDQLVRHIDDALLPAEEVEERISFMESAAFAAGADDGTSAYGIMADAREVARGTEAANQARQDSQEQSNSAGAAASKVDGIASIDAVIGEKHNATKLLLQQQSFAESMAHGSRTLTLSESEQSLPSLLAVGNVAQAMIQYVGDADYRNLSVLQNIELYFKEQVFGSQRPSGKHPFLKYGAAASVKGSAGADGRERLFVRAPSGQSERFVALYFEKVIRSSVRKPAPSYESMKDQQKLTPRRERKSLFRTSSSTGSGRGGGSGNAKGAAAAGIVETEQRQEVELYIAHTDHSVYFINRFVDPKAMFCDAPLLSVEAAHPLYALCKCTIFFGFQRTIFSFADEEIYRHLANGISSPINSGGSGGSKSSSALFSEQVAHQYVVITRDKSRLYPIISNIPKSANTRRAELHSSLVRNVAIENKDQQLVENILAYTSSLGSDHDIVHYQMAYQTWRTRPGVKVPRTVVLTQSMALLCAEQLDSTEVQLEIVDTADLMDVYKILSEDNPMYVTFIIKPARKMLMGSKRKWRLCTDSRTASARLQDICRRTCAEKGNPDV